jgi:hypothetical protein
MVILLSGNCTEPKTPDVNTGKLDVAYSAQQPYLDWLRATITRASTKLDDRLQVANGCLDARVLHLGNRCWEAKVMNRWWCQAATISIDRID